jgi:hypothetical protein
MSNFRTSTYTVSLFLLLWGNSIAGALASSSQVEQDGYFHFIELADKSTGEPYWVAGVNGHTWQVTQRGIVMRLQSERRSGLYAIARRDFIVHGSVNIRPVGPVSFPVRRYDIDNVNDDVVPCYTGLIIDGVLSGGRELHLRLTLDGLQYHAAGTADASDGFSDHGGAILDQAGIPRTLAFPAVTADVPIPFTKSGSWLSVDHVTEELRKPVMVNDPRVLLARYTERFPRISIDREDNILLYGVAPLLESLPITPELIDDSITVRSIRTTKIRPDRSIAWSVYTGPVGYYTITVFDRDNNAIAVYSSSGKSQRGAGTFGPESHGGNDVAVSKWGPDGRLQWSTFVGGDSAEVAQCAAVDSVGNIYIGCQTKSSNFPTTPGAFVATKPNYRTRYDAAVFSLSSDGSQLRWGTYLSSKDIHFEDSNPEQVGTLGAVVRGVAYDGVGGIIVGVHQFAPVALPTTPNAWRTVQRGPSSEALVARIRTDGTVHWSTLISTIAYDVIYCVQNVGVNQTVVLADQRAGRGVPETEQLESIGVPGRTLTDPDKGGFVYEFDSTGVPTLLWAPFVSTESSLVGFIHESPFIDARKLLWHPQGEITPDAIRIAPNCPSGYPSPSVSIVDITQVDAPKGLFTTSILGTYAATESRFRISEGVIAVVCEIFPSRGACLTDTLWGSGYGDNAGERGYLAIVKRPIVSSTITDSQGLDSVVSVYPNPGFNTVNVAMYDHVDAVRVYSLNGRQVDGIGMSGNESGVELDVRSLSPGCYMIRIDANRGSYCKILVIMK